MDLLMIEEELLTLAELEELQEDGECRRRKRPRQDAFHTKSFDFTKNFRLPKEAVDELLDSIGPHLNVSDTNIPKRVMVLAALNFFATGSFQTCVGNHSFLGLCQSSVSKVLDKVVEALNKPAVQDKYVHFASTLDELKKMEKGFCETYDLDGLFNGVVGTIDGTHVRIFPPPKNDPDHPEEAYINRKGFHSINVQFVCDSNFVIRHVNARYPGSTHDQFIFNNCSLKPFFEDLHEQAGVQNFFLLGDSGYALRPWLLIPYSNPRANTREAVFNSFLKKIRNTSEQTNGLIKLIFMCLSQFRVMYYAPEKASKIINACVVLYNIWRKYRMPLPPISNFKDEDNEVVAPEVISNGQQALLEEARVLRDEIADKLYQQFNTK